MGARLLAKDTVKAVPGDRNRRYALARLFVILIAGWLCLPSPSPAQVVKAHSISERRFNGTRFVTVQAVVVRATSNDTGKIVYDAPPHVIIYAEPTGDAGWLHVTGIGSSQKRARSRWSGTREFKNGRFQLVQGIDDDSYYPLSGFVKASGLATFEEVPAFWKAALISVPQPWEAIGIHDERFWVSDQNLAPFNSIVRVRMWFDDDHKLVGNCSGFLVGDTQTVVTANHCLNGVGTPYVFVEQSLDGFQKINTTVLTRGSNSGDLGIFTDHDGEDWAILRLEHAIPSPAQPLRFADPAMLLAQARIKIYNIGYPGDLDEASDKTFHSYRQVLTSCDIDFDNSGVIERQLLVQLSGCALWNGDSGSPLLVQQNGEFRVAGIETRQADYKKKVISGLTPESQAAILRALSNERTRIGTSTIAGGEDFWVEVDDGKDDYDTGTTLGVKNPNAPSIASLITVLADQHEEDLTEAWMSENMLGRLRQEFPDSVPLAGWDRGLPGRKSDDQSKKAAFQFALTGRDSLGFSDWYASFDQLRQNLALVGAQSEDELPTRMLVAEARDLCMQRCKPEVLDSHHQLAATFGDTISPQALIDSKTANTFWLYEKIPVSAQAAFKARLGDPGELGLLMVGGDLFAIGAKAHVVRWVVRDFMGLEGGPVGMAAQHRSCEIPSEPADLPKKWAANPDGLAWNFGMLTSEAVPGATTVSVRQATCLLQSEGKRLAVLSALDSPWGVPGALDVSWASAYGQRIDDGIAVKLASTLAARGIGKNQPILVYCHHANCWMSVNIVKRLHAEGFTRLFWLRDGILGWLRQEAPMGTTVQVPSPLTSDDVASAPPTVAPVIAWSRAKAMDSQLSAEFPAASESWAERVRDKYFEYALGGEVGDRTLVFMNFGSLPERDELKEKIYDTYCHSNNNKPVKIGTYVGCYSDYSENDNQSRLSIVLSSSGRTVLALVVGPKGLSKERLLEGDVTRSIASMTVTNR